MIDYTSALGIIAIIFVSLAIVALHILSVILRGGGERIVMLVNLVLHALLVIPALFLADAEGKSIELEVIVLFYMLSALVYTAAYFITATIERYRERPAKAEREADCDI